MQNRLKKLQISFLFLAFILSGCATVYNPATQKNEFIFIDTQQEISLGKQMDQQVQKQYRVSNNPLLESRLKHIGVKVAAASDRQELTYYFKAIESKELNAFSLPGGFVYVNSALMHSASDDELACVLAHEIAHIAAKHSVKRLQAELGYQIIIGLALGASNSVDMARAMNIVFDLSALGYGREDEFLADKLAVRYSRNAGYTPFGLVTFFEKLKKEAAAKGAKQQIVFLSSHPPIDERIKRVEEEIAKGN